MTDSSPKTASDREVELYKLTVDEYRFQLNLNWQRSQFYFTLNVAILAAATALVGRNGTDGGARFLIAGIFLTGAFCSVFAILATHTQQQYYRAIRDHKRKLESQLNLTALAPVTTTGMGNSTLRRLGKVTTFHFILLGVVGLFDIGAVVYVVRS